MHVSTLNNVLPVVVLALLSLGNLGVNGLPTAQVQDGKANNCVGEACPGARSYGPIPGEDSWRHDRNPTPEVRKWKLPTRHRTSLWAPWTPTYKGGNNPAPLKARSVDPSEREGGKGYGGHPYSKRPLWKIHGPYDGGYSDDDIRPPRTPIYKGWNNPNPNGGNNPGAVKARSVDPFESEIMEEEETGAQAFTEGEGEGEFEDEFEDEFEGGEGEDEIEEVEEENFE